MMSAPHRPHGARAGRPAPDDAQSGQAIPTVEVASLLASGREAVIFHNGERYRLRVTANDKLILTK
ncbi:MAG: hemin uptake protein HemP [Piscinibacter sp.]